MVLHRKETSHNHKMSPQTSISTPVVDTYIHGSWFHKARLPFGDVFVPRLADLHQLSHFRVYNGFLNVFICTVLLMHEASQLLDVFLKAHHGRQWSLSKALRHGGACNIISKLWVSYNKRSVTNPTCLSLMQRRKPCSIIS